MTIAYDSQESPDEVALHAAVLQLQHAGPYLLSQSLHGVRWGLLIFRSAPNTRRPRRAARREIHIFETGPGVASHQHLGLGGNLLQRYRGCTKYCAARQ
jgi:hypothetical protein